MTDIKALESDLKPLLREANRDALIIALALKTGARASEVLNIKCSDINENNEGYSIFIRGLNGSDDREIPIHKTIYIPPKNI